MAKPMVAWRSPAAMGGYHIPIDNDVGLKVGRELATWSWPKYQEYYNGTAKVRE
jgi:hypothetical protein